MYSRKKTQKIANDNLFNLVLWDGACGICTISYKFLKKMDKKNNLKFIPLQDFNKSHDNKSVPKSLDTIHFVSNEKIEYTEIHAIFEILKTLPGFWGAIGKVFSNRIFILLGNPFYRLIARYRYKLSILLRLPRLFTSSRGY